MADKTHGDDGPKSNPHGVSSVGALEIHLFGSLQPAANDPSLIGAPGWREVGLRLKVEAGALQFHEMSAAELELAKRRLLGKPAKVKSLFDTKATENTEMSQGRKIAGPGVDVAGTPEIRVHVNVGGVHKLGHPSPAAQVTAPSEDDHSRLGVVEDTVGGEEPSLAGKAGDRETGIRAFWDWFSENEAELYALKLDPKDVDDPTMDQIAELGSEISKLCDDLSFEIERDVETRQRRLIISANGIVDLFDLVEDIVDSAPEMTHWSVVKFRQRTPTLASMSLKGHTVRPEDVECALLQHRETKEFGIYVFLPEYDPKERDLWMHLGFLHLDQALGEYDVATKVASVDFLSSEQHPTMQRVSLAKLPSAFDYLFNKSRH